MKRSGSTPKVTKDLYRVIERRLLKTDPEAAAFLRALWVKAGKLEKGVAHLRAAIEFGKIAAAAGAGAALAPPTGFEPEHPGCDSRRRPSAEATPQSSPVEGDSGSHPHDRRRR